MKKFGVAVLGLFAVGICGLAAQNSGNEPVTMAITKPNQNERVAVRYEVSGTVSARGAKVWVVIQPRETADCWVQNPIIVNSNRTWRVLAQFGEETPDHSGKPYEVRALANPRGNLQPGRTRCWPEAEAYSDPVYVARR